MSTFPPKETPSEIIPAWDKSGLRGILIIGLSSVVYALVRYVAFAPKNAGHIPAFVLNKAIGMGASFYLVFAIYQHFKGSADRSSVYFRATFLSVVVHIILSLVLLRPGYFPEFFTPDGLMLKAVGETVVLCGGIGLALLWQYSRSRLSSGECSKTGIALLLVLFSHVGFMGIARGLNITAKHGYLPPMWLLSLVAIVFGVLISFQRRKRP